jgi:hypothetical protein
MKLKLNNGMERELSNVKCLAIIPKREDTHITCCGLNIRMEHNSRTEDSFDDYITSFVSKSKTVHGYLIDHKVKIPIDIHGGNTNLCYFGYINPSIFDNI